MARFSVSYWVRHAHTCEVEAASAGEAQRVFARRAHTTGARQDLVASALASDAAPEVEAYCVFEAPARAPGSGS